MAVFVPNRKDLSKFKRIYKLTLNKQRKTKRINRKKEKRRISKRHKRINKTL